MIDEGRGREMDDYDYAGLIKSLREYAKRHCPLDNSAGICGCIDAREVADAMQALLDSVEAYKAQTNMVIEETGGRMVIKFEPKWTPATERLPDDERKVLACYGYNHNGKLGDKRYLQTLAYHCFDTEPRWEFTGLGKIIVTHWMPLPEPPKEEA